MRQLVEEVAAEAVTHEYAAAFKDYCTTLTRLTEQARGGEDLTLDQMDEIDAAKLRLDNARTLCELYVGRDIDATGLHPGPSPPELPARN